MATLKTILDRERHNLRPGSEPDTSAQSGSILLQQLHYRAHCLGASNYERTVLEALMTRNTPHFVACGSNVLDDPGLIRTFKGHSNHVNAVCLSNDGRRAISGSWDETLKLWDVETGKPLRTFKGHSYGVLAVCLSSDGRRAISGSDDHTLKLWDVETGKPLRTFEGHSYPVNAVCLSSDGRRAISGSWDNKLILWDLEAGEVLRRLYVEAPVLCLSMVASNVVFGDSRGFVHFLRVNCR